MIGPATLAAGAALDPLVRDIGLCLLFAGVLTVVFSRLKIPTIAALLVAGILLGPETPGAEVNRESIGTIANLGIVLLLFLIGLEIDLRKLVASGRTLVVTGILQFPLCVAFGWLVATLAAAMGWDAVGGEFLPVYIGIVAAASSTLVVVRLLQERFQLDTVVGRTAVGILILQDIWAIIVLAIQPNFADPEFGTVAFGFLGIGLLCLIAGILARTLIPLALAWISRGPELLLVAAMAWCFGIGFLGVNLGSLAEVVGLHVPVSVSLEMGALIAGASLASHPFTHHIVSKVSVVHDFFITLFFVALGAGIPKPDGSVVVLVAAFLVVVAMTARYVVFLPLFYVTGMDRRNAVVASTRLASISEFCLVIAYLGVGLGHVDGRFVSSVIFAFVATALAAPFIFDAGDRLHGALGRYLTFLGMSAPEAPVRNPEDRESHDIVILGFHRIASSVFHELARLQPALLRRTLIVDFNAALHADIQRRGGHAHYGDISSIESLRAAGVANAKVAVCTVPDDLLRGTSNLRLVRMLRSLSPNMVIIANSVTLSGVRELYEAGADYVALPRIEAAERITEAIAAGVAGGIGVVREEQNRRSGNPDDRDEVLP